MNIRDKNIKQHVDVQCEDCPTYKCYWPRLYPGIYNQGQGYRAYGDGRDKMWLCGRREISGCPVAPEVK